MAFKHGQCLLLGIFRVELVHIGRVASVLVSDDFLAALVEVAVHEDYILSQHKHAQSSSLYPCKLTSVGGRSMTLAKLKSTSLPTF